MFDSSHCALKRSRYLWVEVFLFLLFSGTAAGITQDAGSGDDTAQQKRGDRVTLVNGDRLSGEIRKLQDGVLHIRTELAGEVQVDWNNVETIEGGTVLLFILADESEYRGTLSKAPSKDKIVIAVPMETEREIDPSKLLIADTMDKPPVDRVKGGVSFGLTLLRAKETRQFNLGLNSSYTADKYFVEGSYNSLYTDDNVSEKTQRDYFNFNYQRMLPKDWFFTGMFNTARNDSLGLDFRYDLAGAVGKDIIHRETAILQALAGVGFVDERYENDVDYQDVELVFGLKLKALELSNPRLSLTGEAFIYPRPEDFGHYRAEMRASMNMMLVKTIFWGLSVFDSYNSEPPFEGAVSNDYGLVSSLGVSW